MKSRFIEVLTTFSDPGEAEKFAQYILENRIAACCQLSASVKSIYSWNNKIERDREFILSIKTRKELFDTLACEIRKHHSYETPQIISLDIADISEDYREWIDNNTIKK